MPDPNDVDTPAQPVRSGRTGRHKQRERTRSHLIDATIGLLRQGLTPSVQDIAEAADVSRRTVYMHFPTLDQLLIDARLGMLSESAVNEAIEAAGGAGDAQARVSAMIRGICAEALETLPLGRSLIRLTVEAESPPDPSVPRRGYRRVAWIERALEPLRDQLDEPAFERLVSALAVAIGWEALIVLQDVRGLSPEAQQETMLWAARALIQAALQDRSSPSGKPSIPPARP